MNRHVNRRTSSTPRCSGSAGACVAGWVWLAALLPAGAATLWTGPALGFTEPAGADGTQPQDQDRLTPYVWLTRSTNAGLFNAAVETNFTKFVSPADTEWAYGELTNFATLAYTNWQTWSGSSPPGTLGKDAVAHLISDDIYVAVQFTSWGGSGGGFAYVRSTPPPLAFQSVSRIGNEIIFTWTAAPGRSYQIESADVLAETNWTSLGDPVTATNSAASGSDVILPDGWRYYRVRVLP